MGLPVTGSSEQKVMNMQNTLARDLLQATQLTGSGRLTEATAILQRMFRRKVTAGRTNAESLLEPRTIEGAAELAGKAETMRPADAPERVNDFDTPGFGI
jgi:hypothetical protein